MLQKNSKVTLLQKPGLTPFQFRNKAAIDDIFGGLNLRVSKYITAVNNMTARHTLNVILLRQILGVNPDSHNINWDDLVRLWWSNINISVPTSGFEMEIGLSYDINDKLRKDYISPLKVKNDTELCEYVETHIPVEERFKYGTPINVLNYLQYCYLLIHKEVANDLKDIDKSTNIKLYLFTEESAKRHEAEVAALQLEVSELIVNISKEPKRVRQALIAHNLIDGEIALPITNNDNSNIITLTTFAMKQPKLFKTLVSDRRLGYKAFIGDLLNNNIITRLVGSDVIVLTSDTNTILGSGIDEVINFFIDTKNLELKETVQKQLHAITVSENENNSNS